MSVHLQLKPPGPRGISPKKYNLGAHLPSLPLRGLKVHSLSGARRYNLYLHFKRNSIWMVALGQYINGSSFYYK